MRGGGHGRWESDLLYRLAMIYLRHPQWPVRAYGPQSPAHTLLLSTRPKSLSDPQTPELCPRIHRVCCGAVLLLAARHFSIWVSRVLMADFYQLKLKLERNSVNQKIFNICTKKFNNFSPKIHPVCCGVVLLLKEHHFSTWVSRVLMADFYQSTLKIYKKFYIKLKWNLKIEKNILKHP